MSSLAEAATAPSVAARHDRRLALAAVLALAFMIRAWGLQSQSFTMDEVVELGIARQSPAAILVQPDGLPPLYHLLLHSWLAVFGTDASARWLSVAAGVVAVWGMWRLCRHLGGPDVGMLGALLLAVSAIHVFHSQEARPYALFFLCVVLAIWLFAQARSDDTWQSWAAFGVAALAGLYVHYYFSLVLVALLSTVPLEPSPRRPARRMIRTFAALAVAALPWAWLALSDARAQMGWTGVPVHLDLAGLGYTFLTLLGGYSLGPSLRELHGASPVQAALAALPWAAPLGVATAYLGFLALADIRGRSTALRLLIVLAVPVALCGLLGSVLGVGYRIRYVCWGAAPLLAVLAMGAARGRARWAVASALAVLIGLQVVAVYRRQSDPRYQNEDARGAARWLASQASRSDPVFVASGYMATPLSYYVGANRELQRLPNVTSAADLPAANDLITARVRRGEPFWLVYSRPFDGDPRGALLQELQEKAHLALRATLSGIELYEGRGY